MATYKLPQKLIFFGLCANTYIIIIFVERNYHKKYFDYIQLYWRI